MSYKALPKLFSVIVISELHHESFHLLGSIVPGLNQFKTNSLLQTRVFIILLLWNVTALASLFPHRSFAGPRFGLYIFFYHSTCTFLACYSEAWCGVFIALVLTIAPHTYQRHGFKRWAFSLIIFFLFIFFYYNENFGFYFFLFFCSWGTEFTWLGNFLIVFKDLG